MSMSGAARLGIFPTFSPQVCSQDLAAAMGVPSFYKWLSKKYPKCVVYVKEDPHVKINGEPGTHREPTLSFRRVRGACGCTRPGVAARW